MWKKKGVSSMDKITEIEKKLKKKLSPKVFNQMAQETEFIQRIRKAEGFSIFWSIISGFVIGQATEIAGMLRAFVKDTGIQINYSAWYNRLSKKGFSDLCVRWRIIWSIICTPNV